MKIHVIDTSGKLFTRHRHHSYEADQWHVPRKGETVVIPTDDPEESEAKTVVEVVWHLPPDPEVQVFVR